MYFIPFIFQHNGFFSDVEFAIKRNDKTSSIRIYRSTHAQMQNDGKAENGQLVQRLPPLSLSSARSSIGSVQRGLMKNTTKTDDAQHSTGFLKVRGLPMTTNESFVFDMFIGNYKNIKLGD